MSRPVLACLLAVSTMVSQPLAATAEVGRASGPVILTVRDSDGDVWEFDRAMLESLDWQTITTVTSFTEGPQEFAGVPLDAVVAATGAEGAIVDAVALNDYRVEIPVEHIAEHDIFLALDQNGAPMRVRDRGPIWVIYPSETLEAATDRFDQFMIWQLKELTFH